MCISSCVWHVHAAGLYSEFGDVWAVFATKFPPGEGGKDQLNWMAIALFQLMMGLVQLISLNLLIAIMTDSYDKVRQNTMLEAMREKAQLVLELESTWLPFAAQLKLFPPAHLDRARANHTRIACSAMLI